MKERIFGIETEFGWEILHKNGEVFPESDEKPIRKAEIMTLLGIEAKARDGSRNVDNFQINGGRVYKDTGNHIEYGTPECRKVRDLVIWEKAGEQVVHKMISERMREKNIEEKLIIYKNNTDSTQAMGSGHAWGCHENYLFSDIFFRDTIDGRSKKKALLQLIIPFLITRQIYSGAGWFFLFPRPFYVLSQRAPYINSIESSSTGQFSGRNKQMIAKKSAFSDLRKFARLEIRIGESNLAEWSTYLKVGTTAIVLRMIEDGFLEEYSPLDDYKSMYTLESLKAVTKDITCKRPTVCLNGRYMSPIDVQRHLYLNPAKVYLAHYGASEEERDVLEKWDYILDATADNPLKKLSDRLDIWIRLKFFLDYMEKRRVSWEHWRVGALNLAYGDIDKQRSVFYRLQEKGRVKRILNDREIQLAETNPPKNTRARLRGLMLKLARENNWFYNVDWDSFIRTLKDPAIIHPDAGRCFILKWPNPFQEQDNRVDELIKKYGKESRV